MSPSVRTEVDVIECEKDAKLPVRPPRTESVLTNPDSDEKGKFVTYFSTLKHISELGIHILQGTNGRKNGHDLFENDNLSHLFNTKKYCKNAITMNISRGKKEKKRGK